MINLGKLHSQTIYTLSYFFANYLPTPPPETLTLSMAENPINFRSIVSNNYLTIRLMKIFTCFISIISTFIIGLNACLLYTFLAQVYVCQSYGTLLWLASPQKDSTKDPV